MTSRYRCVCGNQKLPGMSTCFTCDKWERRLNAGSAPEQKRAPAPVHRDREGGGGSGSGLDTPTAPLAGAERAASVFRHPSGRPRRHLYAVGPCGCHDQPVAAECEVCIANGELDWERYHGIEETL